MQLSGNTILITGGGSGIGLGLSRAFHALDNQVIIAGRRKDLLDRVAATLPGTRTVQLDVGNADAIERFADEAKDSLPSLNVLINNAGIQRPEILRAGQHDLADAAEMVETNLLGPVRLTSALLPLLQGRPKSAILNVTSGLAFVPGAGVATYSATKAAMHSYTLSLRQQLRHTTTEVIEIIPPYVQTDLGPNHGSDPRAMPLQDFIGEVVRILQEHPGAEEVVVERCKPLRHAAETGSFQAAFDRLNGGVVF